MLCSANQVIEFVFIKIAYIIKTINISLKYLWYLLPIDIPMLFDVFLCEIVLKIIFVSVRCIE